MAYLLDFDVASLFLLFAVLIHFYHKRTLRVKHISVFKQLLLVSLISVILDIISVITITYASALPLWLNYIINIAYLWCFNTVPFIYCSLIVYLSHVVYKMNFFKRFIFTLPLFILVGLLISTPWTHLVFYFDETLKYVHGPLIIVLYLVAIYYIISAFILTIYCRHRLLTSQKVTTLFYSSAALISIIYQLYDSSRLVIGYAVAVSVLLIYFSLENPADYTNKSVETYNKRALFEVLTPLDESNKPYTIIGLRIDDMGYIHSVLGYEKENVLLKKIGEQLSRLLGREAVFYLGNYEFALFNEHYGINEWQSYIERIHKALNYPITFEDYELSVSATIAVANKPENIDQIDDLLPLLEYSFTHPLNQDYTFIKKEHLGPKKHLTQIVQVMKQHLRDETYMVYYQPIYSAKEKRFTSAEALIRLYDNDYGFISPDEFIPLAEENGMILQIGELVFKKVCYFLAKEKPWEKGIDYIHVNLSSVQCMQANLYEVLEGYVVKYNLPRGCIHLEITETAEVDSSETLEMNMKKFIEQGYEFALDDYGSGYSTLGYICSFPFSTIKMDKLLIDEARKSAKAYMILKHAMMMSHELGLKVIAEGVEYPEDIDLLQEFDCDYYQGYYYSKPLNEEKFIELISSK